MLDRQIAKTRTAAAANSAALFALGRLSLPDLRLDLVAEGFTKPHQHYRVVTRAMRAMNRYYKEERG